MDEAAYNVLEVARICILCINTKDKLGMSNLIDVIIEDDELYTEDECYVISHTINEASVKLL